MSDLSRRTVVRGAAWSIPVVAVAATAPAYAASTEVPVIGSLVVCKLAGAGQNCQTYRLTVGFTVPTGSSWTVAFTSITFDGLQVVGTAVPKPVLAGVASAPKNTVTFSVCSSNSGDKPDIVLGYSLTNEQTKAVSTGSRTFLKFDVSGNCAA